jgi:hypothetical protein
MFRKLVAAAKEAFQYRDYQDVHPTQMPLDDFETHLKFQNQTMGKALIAGYCKLSPLIKVESSRNVMNELVHMAAEELRHANVGKFSANRDELKDANTRGLIFDILHDFAEAKAWTAEDARHVENQDSHICSPFACFCANLMTRILNEGVQLDAIRAERGLFVLAAELNCLHLRGWKNHYRPYDISILKSIHAAHRQGMELSPKARQHARELLDLMLKPSKNNPHYPETKDPAVIVALRDLAGVDLQPTYFQRMHRAGNCREHESGVKTLTSAFQQFWLDVVEQGKTMLQDHENYVAGKPCASWVTNSAAFKDALGDHWEHIEYQFGWWLKVPAQLKYRFEISRSLLGKRGTPEFPKRPFLTEERFDDICARAEVEDSKNRFDAAAANIIDVDVFSFEGKDVEGELFNQFEKVTGASPSAGWQKTVAATVNRIGRDTVLVGFERWIRHLDQVNEPAPRHRFQSYIQGLKHSLGSEGRISGPIPLRDSKAYSQLVFRCAYYDIANSRAAIFEPSDHYFTSSYTRLNPNLSANNETVACGIAHALSQLPAPSAVPLLARLLDNLTVEDEHRACRSRKAVSACCASLGAIGTPEAIALLGKARRHITDKGQLKQIDKALARAGSKEALSLDDMQERAMASHGVGQDGRRVVELEGWRVELSVESTRKAKLQSISPIGKVTRGIAKAFTELAGGKEAAKSLTESVEDIERILPEARRRLEGSFRNRRHWPLAFWQAHLAGNGLLHTIVSRLVWCFTDDKGNTHSAMLHNNQLYDHAGKGVDLKGDDWTVTLWHPVNDMAETVAAWRTFIIKEKIRQPFLQTWRPVYVVTDAERKTVTYSNRFAAHVLEQAPAMAVLKAKGWNAVNRVVDGNNAANARVRLSLAAYGLAAEYWVAGVGSRLQAIPGADQQSTMYAFVATDRLAFFKLEKSKTAGGDGVAIEDVPVMALSEVMLDIDTIVARTSIGNDRNWKDEGSNARYPASEAVQLANYRDVYRAGHSAELAASRFAFLKEILPGLEIGSRCSLAPDYLLVDGNHHSYKINLTSGGIYIAPNDRYICIVPSSRGAKDTLLPFEDDAGLSIIISKALLLAHDDKVDDPHIRSQLRI